jgi:hypothetical protein
MAASHRKAIRSCEGTLRWIIAIDVLASRIRELIEK